MVELHLVSGVARAVDVEEGRYDRAIVVGKIGLGKRWEQIEGNTITRFSMSKDPD
jgi:hypothetical protein